ncbi:MAG TPA: 3-phosphoglycerate dehydrogenase family protein [Fibrobacteraceae bacterium]|nr:3-phosphoglycerate dehydrogenase family protein [Fibrobacteraceae bacterium]
MAFAIKTMNKISPKGLKLFGPKYAITDTESSPDGILVRSAQVDTDAFPSLLAVARAGAGVNNITIDKASAKGICVFNTPGANANAVAELVFIALGIAMRKVNKALAWIRTLEGVTESKEMDEKVEKGKSQFSGIEYSGKTMGIIGLGKIGVLVANGAIGRGMKVIAYEPYPSPMNMLKLNSTVHVTSNLAEVIAASDFLTVHVPLTDKTRALLNKSSLSSFKGSAILNFSRGPIVEDAAVISLIEAGSLKVYVTDFPNPTLIKQPGVICLPHLGASTAEAEENCATMAVDQLKDYLEYGVVRNSVNFPAIDGHPALNAKSRLVVINQDVPNMIAEISKVIGDAGLNIISFKNESNGKLGYNLIDLEVAAPPAVIDQISKLDKVVRVRTIVLE